MCETSLAHRVILYYNKCRSKSSGRPSSVQLWSVSSTSLLFEILKKVTGKTVKLNER